MCAKLRAFTGGALEWDATISRLPGPHLLQTWEWAEVKAAYGWRPVPLVWSENLEPRGERAAALVLRKQIIRRGLAARLAILYVPKGPLLDWANLPLRKQVLDDLQTFARKERAIFLKLDPEVVVGRGEPGSNVARDDGGGQEVIADLAGRGWRFASDQIQFRNTMLIDLMGTEGEMLGRMRQKTRYNIRLAEKKGVHIRAGKREDEHLLYRMYAETAERDGFVIRDEAYYRNVWTTFMRRASEGEDPAAEALIAEVDGEAVAALCLFYFAQRAYYLYGMSRAAHREKMPNQRLQWEAIRRAKMRGCTVYDLWGAPDQFDESDGLWGVYRFKEGLGGEVVRTMGAWDYPASPMWYKTYTGIIPKLLDIMRARGKEKIKRELAAA